jgi:hypothetical protein
MPAVWRSFWIGHEFHCATEMFGGRDLPLPHRLTSAFWHAMAHLSGSAYAHMGNLAVSLPIPKRYSNRY